MRVPVLGDAVPKRRNRFTRTCGRAVLSLAGWRFQGTVPDVSKLVAILAPHTSNWDFVVGLAAIFALDVEVHWIGKHTIFRRPFGGLMRWLGGIPVRRSVRDQVVAQIVAVFDERERLVLGLAPEGTRQPVSKWKTGFYHIAVAAGASILLVTLDYKQKKVRLGPTIVPSGDLDRDAGAIRAFYEGECGLRPERASGPSF